MTKSNKKTTAVIVGILAAIAFMLTGILVLMPKKSSTAYGAGVTKGKVLYLVDAGYVVNSATGIGDIVGRSDMDAGDGDPYPSIKGSKNYIDYGLTDADGKITGLYNTVTDQPFGEDAKDVTGATGTGKSWGYTATTGEGAAAEAKNESMTGGQGNRWCTGIPGDSFGFTTARLVEGKFFGTLTYKFEIPDADAVTDGVNNKFTVSFGFKNKSGWGVDIKASANGGAKINVKSDSPQDMYTLTNVEATEDGGKKYISVVFDTENTNTNIFVNWIMVATPDAEIVSGTIGRKSIAKDDSELSAVVQKFGETGGAESMVELSEASKTALAQAEVLSKINVTLIDGTVVDDVIVLPAKTKHFINIGNTEGGDNAYLKADAKYTAQLGYGFTSTEIGSTWVNSTYDTTIRHSQNDVTYQFTVENGKSYGIIAGSWGGTWGSRTMNLLVSSNGSNYTNKAEMTVSGDNTARTAPFYADSTSTDLYVRFSEKSGGEPTPAFLLVYEVSKVTFDMQGHGDQVAPAYFQGTYNDFSAAPSAAGYTFGGWYSNSACSDGNELTELTASGTAYAKWTQDTYTITYNNLDANCQNATENVETYQYGDSITLGTPTKTVSGEHWRFDGWYSDEAFSEGAKVTAIAATDTGNKTLFAKWVQQYSVSFDLNADGKGTVSGDTPQTILVDKNGFATAPDMTNVTLDGYTFAGWSKSNAAGGATFAFQTTPITADTTLYAKWASQADMVNVTYYNNTSADDDETYNVQSVESGSAISNFPDAPERPNYDFGGWFETRECTGEAVTVAKVVTGNLSLYAKWTLKKYTVSFNTGCDAAVPDQIVEHGSFATAPTGLTNGNKALMGWYTDGTFTAAFNFAQDDITGDITVYARWATITFGKFLNKGATTITAVADDKTGEYIEVPLSDTDKAQMASAEYWSTKTLNVSYNGTAAGSATVTVIPKSTKYFVNFGEYPGATDWSQPQDNPVPNGYRQYSADLGYGFTTITSLTASKKPEVASGQGDGSWKQTILCNFESLVYRFDNLEVGKYYKVVLGHYNPNWGTRPIVVTTTGVGEGALTSKSFDVANGQTENTFTVKTSATSITIRMAKASNKDHPIISYMYLYEVAKAAYNVNHDSSADEVVWLEPGEDYTLPTDVSRNGYNFVGWNTAADGSGEEITGGKVAAGTTAYAQWEAATFNITYTLPQGAVNPNADKTTYTFGDPTYTLQAATLEGSQFIGWHYPLDDTTFITEIKATDYGDITLVAKFVKLWTVTFDINHTDAAAPTAPDAIANLKSGIDKATKPTDPETFMGGEDSSIEYRFIGWYTDAACTVAYDFDAVVTADITLYAKWVSSYKIIFETNGGSAIADMDVSFTESLSAIDISDKTSTRTGYTFDGWYADAALTTPFDGTSGITGDTKVYAKWAAKQVSVVFDSKGGSSVDGINVLFAERVEKPDDPTKAGYIFGGWYKDSACTVAFDFINDRIASEDELTLYAKWLVPQVTVKFDSNGGSAASNVSLDLGGTIATLPTVTKAGYTFAGWYTDKDLTAAFAATTAISEDITLYAKWTANTYTVTFNVNGGSEVAAQSVELNAVAVKPENPTKAGYVFAGWCSDEALTVAFDFDEEITADVTVYAKWVKKTYTVTFNVAGGSSVPAETGIESGGKVTKPEDPTKDGYKFEGWFADAECTVAFDFEAGISADATVYAKWTESKGGCGSTVSSTAVGAVAVILAGLIVLAFVLLKKKRAR